MAIDGRINVDVLFHDTDGTTSLKVVSLEDSTAYTTGKVAIVTGTVGTSEIQILSTTTGYRAANGQLVSITTPVRFAFAADNSSQCVQSAGANLVSSGNRVGIAECIGTDFNLQVIGTAGTASYTLVIYGT